MRWIQSEPGCWIGQISAEQQCGAAMEEEEVFGVHGVFPLPMGIDDVEF